MFAGQDVCRAGCMMDWMDSGQGVCRTMSMMDWMFAGQGVCRTMSIIIIIKMFFPEDVQNKKNNLLS